MTEYLLIALFSVWFAELSTLPQTVIMWVDSPLFKRFKPFDCPKCLAFWLALIYSWHYSWYEILIISGVTSLAAICISRLYYKILS